MPPDIPPGVPAGFEWFASWISEQFGRLEGKLDAMIKEQVTHREFSRMEDDVGRAHAKVRELDEKQSLKIERLEARVHSLELAGAHDSAGDKVRWGLVAAVGSAVGAVILAIVMTFLRLNN